MNNYLLGLLRQTRYSEEDNTINTFEVAPSYAKDDVANGYIRAIIPEAPKKKCTYELTEKGRLFANCYSLDNDYKEILRPEEHGWRRFVLEG